MAESSSCSSGLTVFFLPLFLLSIFFSPFSPFSPTLPLTFPPPHSLRPASSFPLPPSLSILPSSFPLFFPLSQVPTDWCEVALGTSLPAGWGDCRRRDGIGQNHSNDCVPGWTQREQPSQPCHQVRGRRFLCCDDGA